MQLLIFTLHKKKRIKVRVALSPLQLIKRKINSAKNSPKHSNKYKLDTTEM
jgi:hypothetical protein